MVARPASWRVTRDRFTRLFKPPTGPAAMEPNQALHNLCPTHKARRAAKPCARCAKLVADRERVRLLLQEERASVEGEA